MGKFVNCPFCGRRGEKTQEHVWAQWLQESEAPQRLLSGTYGERIPRVHQRLRRGSSGRYETFEQLPGPYAKWLPNLTVSVCADCNSGWMSRLEDQVKRLLSPFFHEGRPVRLSVDDLGLLATWATKCWMAYSLTKAPEQNPFTTQEYRAVAAAPAPLGRSRVWLLHSESPVAQVAIGVASTLLTFGPLPDLTQAQDNTAFGYLAASSVVLYLALVPPDIPAMVAISMTPKAMTLPAVRMCWPSARRQFFPLDEVPDDAVQSLIEYPQELFSAIGLPVTGLNDSDARQVRDDFHAGADPARLRDQWESQCGTRGR